MHVINFMQTAGHLLLSGVFSAYTSLAVVYFEEPDLIKELGDDYAEYMRKVPRFCPWPVMNRGSKTYSKTD